MYVLPTFFYTMTQTLVKLLPKQECSKLAEGNNLPRVVYNNDQFRSTDDDVYLHIIN